MLSKLYLLILLAAVFLLAADCGDTNRPVDFHAFRVQILDEDGWPIEGAILTGGFDWDEYNDTTDRYGYANMPGVAREYPTIIRKTNYFTDIIDLHPDGEYVLKATAYRFIEIGEIDGSIIKADADLIITMTAFGDYFVYGFDGETFTGRLAHFELVPHIREYQLIGDTLWYSTHNTGFYAYSIADPMSPVQLWHLDVEGYLRAFIVKDSLLFARVSQEASPLIAFTFNGSGEVEPLDTIGSLNATQFVIRNNFLFYFANYDDLVGVIDISDPSDLIPIQAFEYPGYQAKFLWGDSLFLQSGPIYDLSDSMTFLAVDYDDPEHPEEAYSFACPGTIAKIVNDSTAIGNYIGYYRSFCVFRRHSYDDYEVIAINSETSTAFYYFDAIGNVIYLGGRLWRLESW